jgi:hypothetical protein
MNTVSFPGGSGTGTADREHCDRSNAPRDLKRGMWTPSTKAGAAAIATSAATMSHARLLELLREVSTG